ncbi:hypothetical protein RJ640_022467 [Escallonia rubra]|uniref:Fanconi-associated nuclease n=1 Tax=Escallonia rubra TaxID=112253 RepID=A0AA88UQY2_9ASTE|nr:hypothetical protein RJ640_022467 [Escallonia rubra]
MAEMIYTDHVHARSICYGPGFIGCGLGVVLPTSHTRALALRHAIGNATLQRTPGLVVEHSTLNLCKDGNAESASVVGAEQSQWQHDKDAVEMSSPNWVTCPVCGDKVEGQDSTINSHLGTADACLARGAKRKLSQRTLLQLNFCSRSKVEVHSTESVDIGANMVQTSLENDPGGDISNICFHFGAKEDEIVPHKSPLNTTYVEHKDGSGENVGGGNLNSRDESSLLLPKTEMPKNDVAECVEEISGLFLATFIVGRRFADEVELSPGASVSLLRDPTNSKDHNAIKGCITSVPERGLAVVPLEVVCRNKISFSEIESDDLQDFRFLWKQAFHVVESARPYLPSMVKCQQNFVLLMQEVLGTNAHLFTFDEKTFLGPWFRMGNISYSDLFDCKQVVKELSGYILLVHSVDELQKDDLEEFMNMLTVGELCDILCAINKDLLASDDYISREYCGDKYWPDSSNMYPLLRVKVDFQLKFFELLQNKHTVTEYTTKFNRLVSDLQVNLVPETQPWFQKARFDCFPSFIIWKRIMPIPTESGFRKYRSLYSHIFQSRVPCLACSEAFLPKWRTGSVSIFTC